MPMDNLPVFTKEEKAKCLEIVDELLQLLGDSITKEDLSKLRLHVSRGVEQRHIVRNQFNLNPVYCALQTSLISVKDIGLRRDSVIAIMLYDSVLGGFYDVAQAKTDYGQGVETILEGLVKVQRLYERTPVIESENFRNLLLSFAEDMQWCSS